MSMLILRLLYYLTGFLLIIVTVLVVGFNLLREFDRKQSQQENAVAATISSSQARETSRELPPPK